MVWHMSEMAFHVRERARRSGKTPVNIVRKAAFNESGAVWDAESSVYLLAKVGRKQGKTPVSLQNARHRWMKKLELARVEGRREVEQEIKQLKHPLSLDILTRFEIREKFNQGISVVKLSKEYKTSVSVVRGVLKMAENLPNSREEELTRQFLRMSSVMRDILQDVPAAKIRNAPLHSQIASAAILADKVLAIRRSLDGESAKKIEVAGLPSFSDRESMIETIRQKMDTLRPILETPMKLLQEFTEGEEDLPAAPESQLYLFPEKEAVSEDPTA